LILLFTIAGLPISIVLLLFSVRRADLLLETLILFVAAWVSLKH
jgi:hypothetical protein